MTHESVGTVYVVHHVDAEGPLWETIGDLFRRLNLVFGISLEPTDDNLLALQEERLPVPSEIKKELALTIAPHSIDFKRSWQDVEEMLLRITQPGFRTALTDSFGHGWIYNWHVMDHVGFGPNNPRHRDIGFLNIFDFYSSLLKRTGSVEDSIQWHFHPVSLSGDAHIPATCYDNSMPILHQILCRRLIDRGWFPVVNRAGFHSERTDSNLFLEQWLPFDASNQAVRSDSLPTFQKDVLGGRYGDWRGAPEDWSIYHPDFYDWRKKGGCNRAIARALNLKSRLRSVSEKEVRKAFEIAGAGRNTYLGVTNHDWREMATEIDEFREMLRAQAALFPKVPFKFSNAIDGFRSVLGFSDAETERNKLEFEVQLRENVLEVLVTNGEIFGPQPYLAIKSREKQYYHDNFDYDEFKRRYSYVFDEYTIDVKSIQSIAVASNDKYGNTVIRRLDL